MRQFAILYDDHFTAPVRMNPRMDAAAPTRIVNEPTHKNLTLPSAPLPIEIQTYLRPSGFICGRVFSASHRRFICVHLRPFHLRPSASVSSAFTCVLVESSAPSCLSSHRCRSRSKTYLCCICVHLGSSAAVCYRRSIGVSSASICVLIESSAPSCPHRCRSRSKTYLCCICVHLGSSAAAFYRRPIGVHLRPSASVSSASICVRFICVHLRLDRVKCAQLFESPPLPIKI
jgi:hypothetical protein